MIFKRRDRPSMFNRLRELLAPRKGFWRGLDYISKRMRRLPDSPHRIALGFACGAFASFTPLFGLHFFVAAGLAWAFRGNVYASLFGTAVGNPLTFPLISSSALWVGRRVLGTGQEGDVDAILQAFGEGFDALWATVKSWFGYGPSMLDGLIPFLYDIFLPYMVGGLVVGSIMACVCYVLLGSFVAAYQKRRKRRIQQRYGPQVEAAGKPSRLP